MIGLRDTKRCAFSLRQLSSACHTRRGQRVSANREVAFSEREKSSK